MKHYDIILPPNQAELDRMLQQRSILSGAVLQLTVKRMPDDLSERRATATTPVGNDREDCEFSIEAVHTVPPPTAIVGVINDNGEQRAARINIVGSDEDTERNTLTLTVI